MKNISLKADTNELTKLFLIALWLIFCLYLWLSLIKPLYQDEGVFLTIGRGITEGNLPYLDYWDHKTPGIYLLWAVVFPLFGTKIILYKIFIWLINLATGTIVYKLSENLKKGSGKFSFIFFLCSLVFLEGNYLIAGQFLGLFLVLASWLLICKPDKYWAYLSSGMALFFAILFKQTAILNILPLLIFVIITFDIKYIGLFITGVFAPYLLVAKYLQNIGAYQEFINQAFSASTKSYPPEPLNSVLSKWLETFRRFWWLWFGIPASFIGKLSPLRNKILIITMSTLPIMGFYLRHYPHYWLQTLPFLAILSGMGFLVIKNYLSKTKFKLVVYGLYLIIIISFISNLLWFKWVTDNKNKGKQLEEQQAVNQINNLPNGPILAENRFTGFNFLTGRKPLTKYLYLTEVNESENARQQTLNALKSQDSFVAVWPVDQDLVYAKEIGDWLANNSNKVGEYKELDLAIYINN